MQIESCAKPDCRQVRGSSRRSKSTTGAPLHISCIEESPRFPSKLCNLVVQGLPGTGQTRKHSVGDLGKIETDAQDQRKIFGSLEVNFSSKAPCIGRTVSLDPQNACLLIRKLDGSILPCNDASFRLKNEDSSLLKDRRASAA